MTTNNLYGFYKVLFVTAFLPYLNYLFPFLPLTVAGFNISGWSWMFMLLTALYYYFRYPSEKKFPLVFWVPWVIYMLFYLLFDFSMLGLQLTAQYLLPIFIAYVASGFTYSKERLHWIFKRFMYLAVLIMGIFFWGYLFRGKWVPNEAQTPMLLGVFSAVVAGIFYQTGKLRFLLLFAFLFSVPVLGVTRMAIAMFIAIFVLHFSNKRFFSKLFAITSGALAVVAVFNSQSFQDKTFYEKKGSLSDVSMNYYEGGGIMNSSGRAIWYGAVEKGLRESPVYGNGPRSDIIVLKELTGTSSGETHNDYLSVRYNYGYIGLVLLLFGMVGTFFSTHSVYRKDKDSYRQLVASSAMVLFFGMSMLMYSDNVLKYTIFFPNPFFAMLGIVYAKFEQQ
jgi:hypothetical protein